MLKSIASKTPASDLFSYTVPSFYPSSRARPALIYFLHLIYGKQRKSLWHLAVTTHLPGNCCWAVAQDNSVQNSPATSLGSCPLQVKQSTLLSSRLKKKRAQSHWSMHPGTGQQQQLHLPLTSPASPTAITTSSFITALFAYHRTNRIIIIIIIIIARATDFPASRLPSAFVSCDNSADTLHQDPAFLGHQF